MKIITFFDFIILHLLNVFIWIASLHLMNIFIANNVIDEVIIIFIGIAIGTIGWFIFYHMQPRMYVKTITDLFGQDDDIGAE